MAKRDRTPQPAKARPAGRTTRRRPTPPVKKPFPWGVVAVSTVIGLGLLGLLVYAITNQGSGFVTALKRADASTPGVKVFKVKEPNHVPARVKYEQNPPVGGPHNGTPQTCQIYTEPVANEHAVHSLEHGAVWITYRPGLPKAELDQLTGQARANPHRMLSPYPDLPNKVSLQAWGRQLETDDVSDDRIGKFLEAYTSGPQAPERGAACSGRSEPGALDLPPPPPGS